MPPNEVGAERLETAAMIVHDRHHVITLGRACDKCRETAELLAQVLIRTDGGEKPPPSA